MLRALFWLPLGEKMARMHSRKKGKSGSTKPSKKVKPVWLNYSVKEIEMLVAKLGKEMPPSKIGLHLRDSYGIPDVKTITGKSITQILKEKNLLPEVPEDLMALIKKAIKIRKHLEENKQDKTAKRGLQLTESKIKRLVKYYKRKKRLPVDWKYDSSRIRLVTE